MNASTANLSLGTRLANYRQRRVHVTDMAEPLVRALFWNREERRAREALADAQSMPSEHGHAVEEAERDIAYARAARLRCLQEQHSDVCDLTETPVAA